MLRRTMMFFNSAVTRSQAYSKVPNQKQITSKKYDENLKWMENKMEKINQNPENTKIDASKFGAAMEKAKELESSSFYYR